MLDRLEWLLKMYTQWIGYRDNWNPKLHFAWKKQWFPVDFTWYQSIDTELENIEVWSDEMGMRTL